MVGARWLTRRGNHVERRQAAAEGADQHGRPFCNQTVTQSRASHRLTHCSAAVLMQQKQLETPNPPAHPVPLKHIDIEKPLGTQ